MTRKDAQTAIITEATRGHIISNYAAAPVGCMTLIDSLYIDFTVNLLVVTSISIKYGYRTVHL